MHALISVGIHKVISGRIIKKIHKETLIEISEQFVEKFEV